MVDAEHVGRTGPWRAGRRHGLLDIAPTRQSVHCGRRAGGPPAFGCAARVTRAPMGNNLKYLIKYYGS